MITKFLKLLFSNPLLTLKLARPARIKNAIFFMINNNGNISQLYIRYKEIYSSSNELPEHDILLENIKGIQSKGDLFLFPIIDWGFRHQRPQHMALALGELGYRVFYFSTTPLMIGEGRSYQFIEQVAESVFVCKLSSATVNIDDVHLGEMTEVTINSYHGSLNALINDLEIDAPTLILNHPYWLPLAKLFPDYSLVYDCMDHHAAFHNETFVGVLDNEQELIRNADFVVTSSLYLSDKVAQIKENSIIRNGCEYDLFSSIEEWLPSKKHVAGYVGAIAEWFDIDLLISVATRLPDWEFVLVGSTVGCDVRAARKLSNIKFVGEVPYKLIADYISTFDVCMIPFKLTELTKATNPVKVYEYLASGRAVVSTPLPEVELLEDKVFIASNADEFAEYLQKSLVVMLDDNVITKWKKYASQQDWKLRAKQFESTVLNSCQQH